MPRSGPADNPSARPRSAPTRAGCDVGKKAILQRRSLYMKTITALAVAAAFSLSAQLAEARITSVTWDAARSQAPSMFPGQAAAFGGSSFGTVGQYEKLRGTATG